MVSVKSEKRFTKYILTLLNFFRKGKENLWLRPDSLPYPTPNDSTNDTVEILAPFTPHPSCPTHRFLAIEKLNRR